MSEINDAAAEAVARELFAREQRTRYIAWSTLGDGQKSPYRMFALDLLTAALPHLTPEPRVITTAEEMEALPIGSVVLDLHGDAGLIDGLGPKGRILFAETAPMPLSSATKHYAPFTVLYNPEGDRP